MTPTDIEVRESESLVVPGTAEVVDLADEVRCAMALDALRQFERQIADAKRALTRAIVERASVLGVSSIKLEGRLKATISKGTKTSYDAEGLEARLRELGMPEDRIREIVKEQITYTVNAVEAKKAARANPEYAAAVEAVASTYEESPFVQIRSA